MPPARAARPDDHAHNHAAYLTQSLPILVWFTAFLLSKCRPGLMRFFCMRFYLLSTAPPSSFSLASTAVAHPDDSLASHTWSVLEGLRNMIPRVVLSLVHDIASISRLSFQLLRQYVGLSPAVLDTSSFAQTASQELSSASGAAMGASSSPSLATPSSTATASVAAAAAQVLTSHARMSNNMDPSTMTVDAARESGAMMLIRSIGSVVMHTSHAALTDTFLTHLMIDLINKNSTRLLKDFTGAFVSSVMANLFLQHSVRYIDTDGRFQHSRSAGSFSTPSSAASARRAAKTPSPLLQALAPAAFFLLSVLSTVSAHPINVLTQTRLYNLNLEEGPTTRPTWLNPLSSHTNEDVNSGDRVRRGGAPRNRHDESATTVAHSVHRDAGTSVSAPSSHRLGAHAPAASHRTTAAITSAAAAVPNETHRSHTARAGPTETADSALPAATASPASAASMTEDDVLGADRHRRHGGGAPSMVYLCGGKGFTYALAGFRYGYYNDLEQMHSMVWSCLIDTVELGMHWMLEGYDNSLRPLYPTSTSSVSATAGLSTSMSHDVGSAGAAVSDHMGEYVVAPNTSVDMLLWNMLNVLTGMTVAFVTRRLPKLWVRYREHVPIVSVVLNKIWPPPPAPLRVPEAVVENASAQQGECYGWCAHPSRRCVD